MENIFKKRQERLDEFKVRRRKEFEKKEVPENVFKSCDACKESVPYVDVMENLYVCPKCGYHMRITARERIRQVIDEKTFKELFKKLSTQNAEAFVGYMEKLEIAMASTGLQEAVVCGVGKIDGYKVAIGVMDANFMMGSMGSVVGEKITQLVEYATKKKLPLIIFCASGGARMQEGIVSLLQMAKTSSAIKRFSDEGGLYISVLTHPTTGGVSASFAMLGDLILAEPKALIGFAGKRVIEKTINETLPPEFQTTEFLEEKGFIDHTVKRGDMKFMLSEIIRLHGGKR